MTVPASNRPSPTHTIWLRQQRAAFIYLPKVACTSWKLFLGRALCLADGTAITYANVHDGAALALPYLSSCSAEEQQTFYTELDRGGLALYSVIREPKERALSAYLDKIFLHKNPHSFFSTTVLPSIQSFHGLDTATIPDFAQFLRWIQAEQSRHCSNDHWRPMTKLLGLQADSEGRVVPNQQWTIWSMNNLQQAAAEIGRLLQYDGAFPGREALGTRPNRNSSMQLESHRSRDVDHLLSTIYCDDLNLYTRIDQSQPKP